LQGTSFSPVSQDGYMKMVFRNALSKKQDSGILVIVDLPIVKPYGIAFSVWRIL
jgi:hypothetical protein